MTVTTNERGQQNIFAKEPQVKVMEVSVTHNEKAEMLNGRVAMLGCYCGNIAYTIGKSYITNKAGLGKSQEKLMYMPL